MNQVSITRKDLSNGLAAVLVSIGETEGMTLPELARVLGVDPSNLRHIAKTNGLSFVNIVHETLPELRAQGVIPITGRPPHFVPKQTVRDLIKIVGTPEAFNINNQLWATTDAVQSGDIDAARAIAGVEPEPEPIRMARQTLEVFQYLQAQVDRLTQERDEAVRTKAHISDTKTATALAKASIASRQNRGLDRELASKGAQVLSLQERLGEASDWKQAIGWRNEFPALTQFTDSQLGKRLTAISNQLGLEIRETPHSKWGSVKVYHRQAAERLAKSLTT